MNPKGDKWEKRGRKKNQATGGRHISIVLYRKQKHIGFRYLKGKYRW